MTGFNFSAVPVLRSWESQCKCKWPAPPPIFFFFFNIKYFCSLSDCFFWHFIHFISTQNYLLSTSKLKIKGTLNEISCISRQILQAPRDSAQYYYFTNRYCTIPIFRMHVKFEHWEKKRHPEYTFCNIIIRHYEQELEEVWKSPIEIFWIIRARNFEIRSSFISKYFGLWNFY